MLITEIKNAISEYEMNTGMKPMRCYLGANEYSALRQESPEYCKYALENQAGFEFLGLRVFKVMDYNKHIRVCL